jgi:DNA primase
VRKEGAEAFVRRIEQATPLSDFLFDKLADEVDMTTLDGRARLVTLARPYLERLPGSAFREMMENRLTRLSGTKRPVSRPMNKRRSRLAQHRPGTLKPLHRALALLLQHPHLAQLDSLPEGWEELDSKGVDLLRQLLEILRKNPHFTTAVLLEHWRDDEIYPHLGKLAATPLMVFNDEAEQFRGCLAKLASEARHRAARSIGNKLRPSDMTEEEKEQLRRLYSGKE